ncbi:hypothetical protein [Planococcus maritimus]|uniref:hypothetical protein n=1 Tax=Planococcus maritimus TaxID=192421 RepID=UPI00232C2FF9|nr:hypothetical protein [Planococcus maritimus]
MQLKFKSMSEVEFDQYMKFLIPDYAKDLSQNYKIPLDAAMEESKALMTQLFSNKQDTAEQSVYTIYSIEEDMVVGTIWYHIHYK